ncbi:MAG: winged helix-turn-helix domain-containing protein [Gammaproteobacteria bacterium]
MVIGSRHERYWLGDVEIRVDENQVFVAGALVRLKPRAMDVLRCLLLAAGEVVSKNELMDRVWPNVDVTPHVLTEAIHEIRRALGDQSRAPRYIQTVPRKGYRTLAQVRTGADRLAARLVVLPLECLSDHPDDAVFCHGLLEELINALGRVRNIEVLGRASSYALSEKDEALRGGSNTSLAAFSSRATHVVSGSLRRTDKTIRVNARLSEAVSDVVLWSEIYDRPPGDVLSTQEDIARRVARTLAQRLGLGKDYRRARSTRNLDAYREFVKGRQSWLGYNHEPQAAMQHYQRSLEFDPEFALPHAGMAECCNTLAVFHLAPQAAMRDLCIDHAERAVSLDPDSADCQFAFGYVQFYIRWNFQLAEIAFRRALEINPSHVPTLGFYAMLLCPLQRREESDELAATMTRLDPYLPLAWALRAISSCYNRNPRAALDAAETGLALNPDDLLCHWMRADGATRLDLRPDCLNWIVELDRRATGQPLFKACAANLYALLGESEPARQIGRDLESTAANDHFISSLVHVALGRPEAALESLEAAEHDRDAALWSIACAPYFDALRIHPRFHRLRDALGLPPLAVDDSLITR